MERKDTPQNLTIPLSPEALIHKLDLGLLFFKNAKYGKAIACFREVAKNIKILDPSKQRILVKALQGVGSACLKKAKYKKVIKSAKICIKVIHCIKEKTPELADELNQAQEKLLKALEGYLQVTIEQYHHIALQDLKHGKLSKVNLLAMCRDGFSILKKPLPGTDASEGKIIVKCTKTNLVFKDTLEKLLIWIQQLERASYERKDFMNALIYCKIAAGPLRESLYLATTFTGQENSIIDELKTSLLELEKHLAAEAAAALEHGRACALNPKELEQARDYFREAAQKYSQLEQPDRALQALNLARAIMV